MPRGSPGARQLQGAPKVGSFAYKYDVLVGTGIPIVPSAWEALDGSVLIHLETFAFRQRFCSEVEMLVALCRIGPPGRGGSGGQRPPERLADWLCTQPSALVLRGKSQ